MGDFLAYKPGRGESTQIEAHIEMGYCMRVMLINIMQLNA